MSKKLEQKSANKRYDDSSIRQMIDLANILPPEVSLPDPRDLEPKGRHADLMKQLTEGFVRRFRPRVPLSRQTVKRETARVRKELERRDLGISRERDLTDRISRYAEREYRWSRNWGWFSNLFVYSSDPDGSLSRRDPDPVFLYRLFWTVRMTLAALAEAGRAVEGKECEVPLNWELPPVVPLLHIGPDTRIGIISWNDFLHACAPLEGLEVTKIRQCPACDVFYFAKPSHKGACDLHLGLVRQWRARDKRPVYELNRERNRNARAARESGSWKKAIKLPPGGKRK